MTARERVSYAIRFAISHALYHTGLLTVLLKWRLRHRIVILAYHRVLTPAQRSRTASQDGLIVLDSTFARHAAALGRHFTTLSLDEFSAHLSDRIPFRGPACLITFDDGWRDNLENALPILQAHNLPAVMFLPVNFIGGRRLFTREALTHLLVRVVHLARKTPRVRELLRSQLEPMRLESVLDIQAEDPLSEIVRIVRCYRYASGPAFEKLVAGLSARLDIHGLDELSETDHFVDWDQVELLRQGGFAFGGHGAEHYVLTEVSPREAQSEIESSKRLLDRRLRRPIQAFAYPNGGWNSTIADMVGAAGYRFAFTIDAGFVGCDHDPLALPRLNIHEDMTQNTPMFLSRLAGII